MSSWDVKSALSEIFFQELSMGVCILDKNYRVQYWNPWLESMTGINGDEIYDKNLLQQFPQIEQRNKARYLEDCFKNCRTIILSPFSHEYFLPIEIVNNEQKFFMKQKTILFPIGDDKKIDYIAIVIEDLTEQILHENEINRLTRILNGLRHINRIITTAKAEKELLKSVCKILVEEMNYLFAWVGFIGENEIDVTPVVWHGISDELMKTIKVARDDSVYGKGVGGMALKTGKIQAINTFRNKRSLPWMHISEITGSKGACAIPLKIEKDVIGILAVDSREQNVFEEEEVRLLEEMGQDISFGIKALRDEMKRREAEKKLILSAREWAETFDAISDSVCIIDKDQKILRCNKAFVKFLQKDYGDIIGKNCYEVVHRIDRTYKGCPLKRMKESLVTETFEMQIEDHWYNVTVDPIFDEENNLTGAVHVMKDITEMKNDEFQLRKTLKEREMLLQEIHHRVKNNLAVVISLLNVQSRQIRSKEEALEAFKESIARIRSMAMVHEKLYHSHTLSEIEMTEFVPALVKSLYMTYNVAGDRIKLSTDIDQISLGIDIAVPAGLLLNELISNSLKHAFPESRSGMIEVRMKKEAKNRCILQVIDDGVGFPEDINFETCPSLGIHLIRLLADQLEGSVGLERKPKTCISVHFKLQ